MGGSTAITSPAAAGNLTIEQYLRLHLQPEQEPVVTDDEITSIITLARRVDADGNEIGDADYVLTYDFAAAVAMGWELKAGKAAGSYDFSESGLSFDRSQIIKQCLDMARVWKSKCGTSATIKPGTFSVPEES